MAFGIWTLARAHSQVGTCTTTNGLGANHSGIDANCVQTLMSYSLGFVFVASGLIVAVIALTMIAKQERIDLHSELKAVPRTWGTRRYVATSQGLDEPADTTKPLLYVVKTG
jgi:hydrogenase/urease accessory protein HupE